MKLFLFVFFILGIGSANASTGSRLDIYEFTREALALDVEFQDVLFDKKISEIKADAASNLYRGQFSIEPYSDRYNNSTSSYFATTYKEKGLKSAYTQFLPIGTAVTFGYQNVWENTRSTSPAVEEGYSIGLVQPLFKNFFGMGERAFRDAYELEAKAGESRARFSRNDACGRATETYVNAWTQEKRSQFVGEVLQLATELHKRSEPATRTGQIGQLDWWGVQSEYLNLQDQKAQAELGTLQQRLSMTRVVPAVGDRQLSDPSDAFQKMLGNLKSEQKKEATHTERFYEQQYEAEKLKAKGERSFSRPDLNLKLTQRNSEGKAVSAPYEDTNTTVSLEFVWQLNDSAVDLKSRVAQVEAERALFKSREINRTRENRFKEYVAALLTQANQIELEKKRVSLLGRITEEKKRRFLQGRLDFQDFLRVKEQWFDTQNRLLDKQAVYWKNLASFSLTENFPVPFCQEPI